MSITRRQILGTGIAGGASAALLSGLMLGTSRGAMAASFAVHHSDAEWKHLLPPATYEVMRHEGTERAFTSPLLNEHRRGTFVCAACVLPLFASSTKFDSGTGWPSFWQPLPHAVGTQTDTSLLETRNEVHCSRCGGHLGHVFDDGPQPTGLRYCMNGVALKFKGA